MKRFLIPTLSVGGLVVSASLALLFFFGFFNSFQIVEGSENAKVIEVSEGGSPIIEFSRPVKKSSIEENVVLDPAIKHTITWVNARTFKIVFETAPSVGTKIDLSSTKPVQDILGNVLKTSLKKTIVIVGKPQIVLALPKETSEVKNKIIITFSRPMTALSTLDQEDKQTFPVKIEPAVQGKFRWLGTSAIEFSPTDRFAYATHYTVTIDKNTADISGGKIGEDFVFTFDTPVPSLLSATALSSTSLEEPVENPLDNYTFFYGKDSVKLVFNQPVSLASVEKSLKFLRIESNTDEKEQKENGENFFLAYEQKDGKEQKENVIFTPQSGWKESANYKLELSPEYASLEGTLPPAKDDKKTFQFSGLAKLAVNFVSPADKTVFSNEEEHPYYGTSIDMAINFSAPMNPEKFAEFISIEPKADVFTEGEQVYLQENDTVYRGYWNLDPSKKYKVTISKNIPDRFGRTLGQDYSWEFTTAPLAPNLYLESRSDNFGVFESGMPPNYRIGYVNIKKVNVALAKLSFDDVLKIRSQSKTADWNWKPDPSQYDLIESWSFDIPKNLNAQTIQNLGMEKHVRAEDKRFDSGIFLVDVWSPEVKDYEGKIIHTTQIFSLTPYALTLKFSRDTAVVFASHLKDAMPVSKMKLEFIALDGKTQYTASTNEQGMTELSFDPKKLLQGDVWNSEFFVRGEKDGKDVWIGSNWNSGIEAWKFNLSERWPGITEDARQIMGRIVTDRPLYKPGETIYFKGIVRNFNQENFTIPKGAKVSVQIMDNEWKELSNKEYKISDFGSFDGEFKIPDTVAYGYFTVQANIQLPNYEGWNNTVSERVWVTHFQKAPFKVSVNLPQKDYFWGDKVAGTITAETFYGARLANQKATLSVNSTDYYFNRYQDDWYSFSTAGNWCYWNCSPSNHFIVREEKNLDTNGSTDFSFPIESKMDESNPVKLSQVYTLSASVLDSQSGQEVTGNAEMIAHYTDVYLGVKTSEYMVMAGDDAEFQVISLDPQGNSREITLKATLLKREYKSIKRKGNDGDFYYENETKDTELTSKSLVTGADGKGKGSFAIDKGGSYIVRVSTKDSAGREAVAETEIWASSREAISWPRANHDRIEIIADKKEYKIGDTAKLMIKSPYAKAKAFVTTEQDSVLTKKLIDITSNAQVLEIPITENYVPNVYVSVIIQKGRTESGKYDETQRDLGQPDFKIGYIKLPVNTASKKLSVEIKTDKVRYQPQEEVKLNLSVKDFAGKGAPSELAVMVVDMSLLALTGYTEPDLITPFYSERGLGVKTSLTMSKFIERFKPGAKGGDGGDKKKRGEFKNTAYWVASLVTDKNGNAVTKFKLPDNLTTWKVTVVAQDKLHRFGAGNTEFMEVKKLMIDPLLPQFFTAGDQVEIPVVITNKGEKANKVQVSVKLGGSSTTSKILGSFEQSLTLNPDERKEVRFTVQAGSAGNLTFNFTAKGEGAEDSMEDSRRINPLTTEEVVSISGQFEDQAREALFLPKEIIENMGSLDLRISPTLAYLLPHNLQLLRNYSYECAEQTISKIFPNALVLHNKLLNILFSEKEKKEIEDGIVAGLSKIYTMQNEDGSWGYFNYYGTKEYRNYLTSYIVIVLKEMKKSGVLVDAKALSSAENYLQNERNIEDLVIQGFIRLALAEDKVKSADKEYARRTLGKILTAPESAEALKMPRFALVYWALAMQDVSLLDPVLKSAKATDKEVFFDESVDGSAYWNTPKRTTALVLYALEKLQPDHPYIPKMVHWMNTNRNANGYGNTQENVWTLLALIRHTENEKLEKINNTFTVDVAGENVLKGNFDANGIIKNSGKLKQAGKGTQVVSTENQMQFASEFMSVPLAKLPQNEDFFLDFAKQGNGKLYYDAVLSYFVPAKNIKMREEGFTLLREYQTLDGKRLDQLPKVGETFKVHLTIVAPKEGNFVALEDFVPAGVMPINTAFATERNDLDSQLKNTGDNWWEWGVLNYFQHQEFRDDRVFLFAELLPAGVYEYEYAARVTHTGTFSLLPARVFEMYNEDRFGRTEGREIMINE